MTLLRITETAMYADDLDAAKRFYTEVLGLTCRGATAGRSVFFNVGPDSMLLVFNPEVSLRGDVLPAHGSRGPSHFAIGIATEDYEGWKVRLLAHGVAIEQEVTWPAGGRSIYFRDPAGNSVELATPGIWNLPSGW